MLKDAFKDNGKKLILAEVIVGRSYDIKSNHEKLMFQSLTIRPKDQQGKEFDSVTHKDMIAVYSNTKCYPRYLITF